MDVLWELLEALMNGDLDEVERLFTEDPGLLDVPLLHGNTLLIWAAGWGEAVLVRWLLRLGASIDLGPNNGQTALWHASFSGRLPVVKLLVEWGADPVALDHFSSSSLHVAATGDHPEVVRYLLGLPSVKAMINHRDMNGRTALWNACQLGHGDVAGLLLEAGADPTIADTHQGITPMAVAKEVPDENLIAHEIFPEGRAACVAVLEVSICPPLSPAFLRHPLLSDWLTEAWGVFLCMMAGGGAELPPVEGPAGGRCGFQLRGAGDGGEDARRGQASARGGGAGGAEGSCGGRGR
jgi:hypothetical protein